MSRLLDLVTNGALMAALGLACAGAGDSAREIPPRSEARPPVQPERPSQAAEIRIVTEGSALTATLDDTEVARDFASLLPLSLTLTDYASTEKVSDLPRKLSTRGSPEGTSAAAGDIMHYAPWGNIALFYGSAPHAAGLVRLGRFDEPVRAVATLRRPGRLAVKIERVED